MDKKIAIIDLGSNSVRMLIMRLDEDGSYKMLDQAKEMVRLGENMGLEKTLKAPSITRTIDTLRMFRNLLDAYQVTNITAVATAAVRSAANQQEFLDLVSKETGFQFTVISGDQEAYYDYLAVINTITTEDCVIVDIGGASTELVLVENRKVKEKLSLPFGAVSLAEAWLSKGNYEQAQLYQLANYIKQQLLAIPWFPLNSQKLVIGLGGSIRTIAKIDKRLDGSPFEGLHNYSINSEEVHQICKLVTSASLEERAALPGLDKDRADILPAGLTTVSVLLRLLDSPTLTVCGNGLREGLFFGHYLPSTMQKKGLVSDVLKHSVNNLLNNYEMNLPHCKHICKLSLALFHQTQALHNMDAADARVLSAGALLHDIGIYVNYYNHHKHGFYLVLNSRLSGLSNKELAMCAYIVRLHSSEDSKVNWSQFTQILDKTDQKKIKKLGLFVRLAEQLDRSEASTIEDLTCEVDAQKVKIKLKTRTNPELELAEARKCLPTFEKLFKKKVAIIWG